MCRTTPINVCPRDRQRDPTCANCGGVHQQIKQNIPETPSQERKIHDNNITIINRPANRIQRVSYANTTAPAAISPTPAAVFQTLPQDMHRLNGNVSDVCDRILDIVALQKTKLHENVNLKFLGYVYINDLRANSGGTVLID